MAVCCQTLRLGTLSRLSALSMLIVALFKKSRLFLITPRIHSQKKNKLSLPESKIKFSFLNTTLILMWVGKMLNLRKRR